MTTEEKIKLVAVFMGWTVNKYEHLPNKVHKMHDGDEVSLPIDYLQYDSKWDEQIPAWRKAAHLYKELAGSMDARDKDKEAYWFPRYLKSIENYSTATYNNDVKYGFEILVNVIGFINTNNHKPIRDEEKTRKGSVRCIPAVSRRGFFYLYPSFYKY